MNPFWNNRQIFVTGASGFVGAHIVEHLAADNANVICLERDTVRVNSLDLLNLRDKVTVINGSVDDLVLMERIINEFEIDSVFHLAAQALVGAANRSPISTFESNIRGTYMLLEACRRSPRIERILVASSDKAYGTHPDLPYSESYALQGVYPYDVSKTCTDLIAQSFAHSFQLPVCIIRSANIYGAGDVNLSRIIPGTIISILNDQNPVIRSDGSPIREFIYVRDVVDAYLLLAQNIDSSQGEAFNLGTNQPIKMLNLVEMIIKLMKAGKNLKADILLKSKIDKEIDARYLSGEKIEKKYGWQPAVSLEEGLNETINWYQNNFERFK